MKKAFALGLTITALTLSGAAARAGGLLHKDCDSCAGGSCAAAPCAEGCVTPPTIALRAIVTQHKYTVEVPVVPAWTTKSKEITTEQPVCHTVPVCVTDPCTGCTRTEYKTETHLEKVKATVIEVVPPAPDAPCFKKEEHIRYCTKVILEELPAPAPACASNCAPLCDQ